MERRLDNEALLGIPAAMAVVSAGYTRMNRATGWQSAKLSHTDGAVAYTLIEEATDSFGVQRHPNASVHADWRTNVDRAIENRRKANQRLEAADRAYKMCANAPKPPVGWWLDKYTDELNKAKAHYDETDAEVKAAEALKPDTVPVEVWTFKRNADAALAPAPKPDDAPKASKKASKKAEPPVADV